MVNGRVVCRNKKEIPKLNERTAIEMDRCSFGNLSRNKYRAYLYAPSTESNSRKVSLILFILALFFVGRLKTEWQIIGDSILVEEVCLRRTKNIFSILCLDYDIDSS